MRILSYSHVARDPAGGAASATLLLNAALRERGHTVEEFFADEFGSRDASTRAGREQIPISLLLHAWSRTSDFDVVEATGYAGWLAFPLLRAKRRRRRPLLVARSYGLEHFDHQVRIEEHRAGGLDLSLAYRVGGGFLTLREVEVAVAASDLFAAPRPGAALLATRRRLKPAASCLVTGFGVSEIFLSAKAATQPERRVAWVGTTIERKGWPYFVEGLSRALHADGDLSASLFGTRTAGCEILAQFPADVRSRITVHGILSEAQFVNHLTKCACFVSTSLSEGYHLAVLQSMAVGLPVIATREGFLADRPHAEEHETIYREIEKRSPESLVAALGELANPAALERLKATALRGRAYAAGRSWRQVAGETAAAYERRIARRRNDFPG